MADKKPVRWHISSPEGEESMGMALYLRDNQEFLRQTFSQDNRVFNTILPDGTAINMVLGPVVDFIQINRPVEEAEAAVEKQIKREYWMAVYEKINGVFTYIGMGCINPETGLPYNDFPLAHALDEKPLSSDIYKYYMNHIWEDWGYTQYSGILKNEVLYYPPSGYMIKTGTFDPEKMDYISNGEEISDAYGYGQGNNNLVEYCHVQYLNHYTAKITTFRYIFNNEHFDICTFSVDESNYRSGEIIYQSASSKVTKHYSDGSSTLSTGILTFTGSVHYEITSARLFSVINGKIFNFVGAEWDLNSYNALYSQVYYNYSGNRYISAFLNGIMKAKEVK